MSERKTPPNLIERLSQKYDKPKADVTPEMPDDDEPASLIERAEPAANETDEPALPPIDFSDLGRPGPEFGSPAAPSSAPFAELNFERLARAGLIVPGREKTLTTEEFRVIKRPLLLNAAARVSGGGHRLDHVILVTSARPGEGKTFTSINLAMSMATERDLNVMLVDADIMRHDLLNRLGVQADLGLLDVLQDPQLDISDVLIKTNIPNLTILPGGKHRTNSTELFASQEMGQLIHDMAMRYDDRIILFDTPPLLVSSEASALALHVGQVLVVVESGVTPQSAIDQAISLIDGCEHTYFVFNKAPATLSKSHYGEYAKFYA